MRVGHTGITWGIPGDVEAAYRETAELGYLGFETFGFIIRQWNERPGGYRALVDRYGIPTGAAYCDQAWLESTEAVEVARREAEALREVGGTTLVLGAGLRPSGGYTADQFARLGETLNRVGRACQEVGSAAALHPHTGTPIETRADIDAIMALLDPDLVGFAPDTGQIAKGGGDVLAVMCDHHDRIVHVHLKDWNGRHERDANGREIDASGYLNYEPIGGGILPMPALLEPFIRDDFTGWINVELDGMPTAPRPPREAAAMSRRYLGELLGDRVPWGGVERGARG